MRLRTALATLLAFALLWWFLRDADLGAVWTQVRNADLGLLAVAFVAIGATYVARAIRWQYLLAPVGGARFRTAFRTTIIGFAALTMLPARVGDLLRPYLLARQEGLSPPATFATVVMERVLDLLAVLALLAIYLWGFADPTRLAPGTLTPIQVSASIAGGVAVVLMGVMWILASHPERIGSLVLVAARVLPRPLAERLARIASVFSSGFAASRKPRILIWGVFWSFPIWLAIATEAWAVTRAFGISMPFSGGFLLQALLVIGVAVPTPAGVGSYHAAYRYGVTTYFGAPENQAVAAAIVVHAVSFFPVTVLGIIYMAQDGLSVGQLRELASEARAEEMPDADEVPILRKPGR
jgi:uncharacterized protein (TIRG00374 family)